MAKTKMGRIGYDMPINYNYTVKIGPWFEETSKYVKMCHKHESTYNTDYVPLGLAARDEAYLWNNKFKGDGISLLKDPDYLNNYSSSYDLSYNHFPRCFKGSLKREWANLKSKYEPEIDYALNYGSVTRYGLVDYKKDQWIVDKCRSTPGTTYNEMYVAPKLEDFKFKRHATPIPNSTKLSDPLIYKLGLRGEHTFQSPDTEKFVVVQPEPRCNPVTWECPKPLELNVRRCIEDNSTRWAPYFGTPHGIPIECVKAGNKEFRK